MKRSTRNAFLAATLLAALVAGTGCKQHVKTPDEFAKMENPGYSFEFRAISPDEVVIGVQKKANEPKGDLTFWTSVWKDKFPPIKDYQFVETKDFETDAGRPASLLTYTSEEEDGLFRMMVGLVVVKKNIWILTAGGKDESVKSHEADILAAFESFKP